MYKILIAVLCALFFSGPLAAQNLTVSTVTRQPFSMVIDEKNTGFSIELLA